MTASLRIPTHSDYELLASWITDAAACRRWAGPRVPFPFSPAELPQLLTLEDGASFCLVQTDAAPLGFGQYSPRPNNVVHLMRLIVSRDRRGEGWGRELCVQLIARAVAATGAESVTLKVYADNLAAVSLYESLGFHRDASEHGSDSLLMRMPVSDSKASRA